MFRLIQKYVDSQGKIVDWRGPTWWLCSSIKKVSKRCLFPLHSTEREVWKSRKKSWKKWSAASISLFLAAKTYNFTYWDHIYRGKKLIGNKSLWWKRPFFGHFSTLEQSHHVGPRHSTIFPWESAYSRIRLNTFQWKIEGSIVSTFVGMWNS